MSAQWSGPLPPPGALDHFNRIIPDGANRIMLMIEREQAHRIAQQTKELDGLVSDFRRGHWLGAGLGVLAVGAAAFTAYIGAHPSVSISLVSLPVAGIIYRIMGRR